MASPIQWHEFEQTLGDCEGQGSLVCCSTWGCKELDMSWQLNSNNKLHILSLTFLRSKIPFNNALTFWPIKVAIAKNTCQPPNWFPCISNTELICKILFKQNILFPHQKRLDVTILKHLPVSWPLEYCTSGGGNLSWKSTYINVWVYVLSHRHSTRFTKVTLLALL